MSVAKRGCNKWLCCYEYNLKPFKTCFKITLCLFLVYLLSDKQDNSSIFVGFSFLEQPQFQIG